MGADEESVPLSGYTPLSGLFCFPPDFYPPGRLKPPGGALPINYTMPQMARINTNEIDKVEMQVLFLRSFRFFKRKSSKKL